MVRDTMKYRPTPKTNWIYRKNNSDQPQTENRNNVTWFIDKNAISDYRGSPIQTNIDWYRKQCAPMQKVTWPNINRQQNQLCMCFRESAISHSKIMCAMVLDTMVSRRTSKTNWLYRKIQNDNNKPEVVTTLLELRVYAFRIDAIDFHCRAMFHCIGNPQKHGSRIWNRIYIYDISYSISTSGFGLPCWILHGRSEKVILLCFDVTRALNNTVWKFVITFLSIKCQKLFLLPVSDRPYCISRWRSW